MAGPSPADVVTDPEVEPALARLAAANGVATHYIDADDHRVAVPRQTVVRVLAALDVDASTPAAVAAALASAERAPWGRLLPPTVVVRQHAPRRPLVRGPAGAPPLLGAELADGTTLQLPVLEGPIEAATVDGEPYAAWSCPLPAGLPLGWHLLTATVAGRTDSAVLVVTPDRLEMPAGLGPQAWGWMVQLYAVRSAGSWGMGDLADLAELVRWSGSELGADAVLCNPLPAVAPVLPIEPSPYHASSRLFWNPLYLRVEAMAEYVGADPEIRARVDALRVGPGGDRIDRDATWRAKSAAWELLWPLADAAALAAYREQRGRPLADFARFCALAERYGVPWQGWPAELRRPDGPAVEAATAGLADRVAFHAWLQLRCEEQLAAAQAAARAAGMAVGVVHDLPVGVDPGGADAWATQDVLAAGMSIGAPPDSFAMEGQSWGLPPWRPDRLAELGYAPYAELLRAVLRYGGGVRIDHVLGLFRSWWVPAGEPPSRGTYVHYDEEALLGVLALEAQRAGALVVGEDLGTVEPRVRTALADRGILRSAVLWFQRDSDGELLPPERWPEQAAASVSTHDLPTAAGFLVDGPVAERAELLAALRRWELLADDAAEPDVVAAMHALLRRTPCRLLLAALADGVGDRSQPNRPGTTTEYPNWRLPLCSPGGGPVLLEQLRRHPGVRRLAATLSVGNGLAARTSGHATW